MVKRNTGSNVNIHPKKTSMKEVSHREEEFIPQPRIDTTQINTMAILADPYPKNGEDYAVQLFYKTYRNPHIRVTEKSLSDDLETANITVNDTKYTVNIRTGKIQKV
jgi:hypothetical protein